MADLPVLKTQRYREEPRKKGDGVKRIPEAFFIPGPNAEKYPGGPGKFRCPGGPGMGPIPSEGKWYDVSVYLLRRVLSGDAAEGSPQQDKPKPPKAEPKKAAPKAKE